MEKSRLGVKVCLLGALSYWLAMFGGFIPTLLLAGYVLLLKNDKWLKKSVLNAFILSVFLFQPALYAVYKRICTSIANHSYHI